ncbi:hypothetical protein PO878_09155 [Iamia majanohamensis]|uniref:Uncharacterized protein n=1 Tax=Iamia majanohamensis TaxID=467976 RepID=A0AAF0BXB5_9ACTN|nr:hypothetical protein [Iamia majanohamensis]WCO68890.1 hypothetical protein PO878_09155 [Iamia majanohamensis]
MFRAVCAAEGAEVLLTTRRITAIHRPPGAVVVEFRCWCGHPGRTVDRMPGAEVPPVSLPRSA